MFKKFYRFVGRSLFYCSRGIIKRLPYKVYRVIAIFFLQVAKLVMYKKRQIALQNLKFAFGREKSDVEIKKIAKAYFQNFGRGMVDNIYFADRPHLIEKNVRITGQENIEKALAKGNGVILTGGHFGDFLLMYLKLVHLGYKTNVIMRRVRDDVFEKTISKLRKDHGVNAIYDLPAKKCVVECIKALRRNEVLVILLDQNYGSAGRVFVDFFDQKAATATGPVVFSSRTKAPILPIFCLHDEGIMKHKVIVEPEILLDEGENEQETLEINIQKITNIIEQYVRKYPHEWGGWIHKRWKSKPLEEQRIIDQLTGAKKAEIGEPI